MNQITLFILFVIFSISNACVLANLRTDRAVIGNADTEISEINAERIVAIAEFQEPISGDLYIATQVNGTFTFIVNEGNEFSSIPTPFRTNSLFSEDIVVLNVMGQGIPPGHYPIFKVVTQPGTDPFDFRNWIGGLHSINFIVGLSDEESLDFDDDGFPDDDLNHDGFHDDDRDRPVDNYLPNDFLAGLPDKTWAQIPNSKMTKVASTMFYNGVSTCCGFDIFAYSGAVKDTRHGRILFWGGGHNDYHGNEIYQFDLETLTWERLTNPSPKSQECSTTGTTLRLSDGQPKSRHTYDQMAYITHQNKLWAYGGSICGPGSGIRDLWTFDLETKHWTDLNPSLEYSWSPNLGLSAEYDPITQRVYYFGKNQVKVYDINDNTWEVLSAFSHPIERSSVLHPRLRKIVTYAGYPASNQVSVFDIQTRTVTYPPVADVVPKRRAPGWAFDSKNELFLSYGGYGYSGRDVWYFDVESNTWFSELIPGGPDGNHFHYERFVYDAVNNVTYFFRSAYEDVWVLKNQHPTRP